MAAAMEALEAAGGVHTFMRWLLSAARWGMMSSRPPPSFRSRPCSALRPETATTDQLSAVNATRPLESSYMLEGAGTRTGSKEDVG